MNNIYTTQERLIETIKTSIPKIQVLDNVLPPLPTRFPFVAVDPQEATLSTHAGGTLQPRQFFYDIYILDALSNHRDNLAKTRQSVASMADAVLAIHRLYANSIIFGEDVIGSTRCSLIRIRCSFPV